MEMKGYNAQLSSRKLFDYCWNQTVYKNVYTKMVVLFTYNEVKIMIKCIIPVHLKIIFLDHCMVFNAETYEFLFSFLVLYNIVLELTYIDFMVLENNCTM